MINIQRPQIIYIVGPASSGKTTTIKWIMNKLDISLFKDTCTCVSNPTRNVYFLRRYKSYYGISQAKKNWMMVHTDLYLAWKHANLNKYWQDYVTIAIF